MVNFKFKSNFEWSQSGLDAMMNSSGVKDALERVATKALRVSLELWELNTRHESSLPVLYAESFRIKRARALQKVGKFDVSVPTVRLVNVDPEWFFVEFGVGHGPGKPGYKYRILGRTLDALAAGA